MNFPRASRLCLLILLGFAVGTAVYAVVNDVQRSRIVHQLDYEEGNILNAAVRIDQGLTPYPDPHGWPVAINPYGPLPYYLTAIPVHFFGPSFAPARAVIIVAGVICALLAGLLVHQFTRSAVLATGFGCLFLSQRLVELWMPVLRVDFIGLALVLLALYVFARFPRWWVLAALLLAMAMFTKFSLLAAPCACFVLLLVQRQWKRAAQFAVVIALSVVALFGIAILVTHGAFAYDVFMTEGSPMDWLHLPGFYRLVFFSDPLLVLIGVAGLIWACWKRRFELPVLYAIFALLGSVTAAKVGSNMNHLIEFVAALCILAGWFVGQMVERGGGVALATSAASAVVGLWMVLLLPYAPGNRPVAGCTAIYNAAAQLPSDRILSEDVGLLVVEHKSVWVAGSFAYALLAESGKVPDTKLQQRIREKWFDYIILSADPQDASTRWSPQVRRLIGENYARLGEFGCRDASLVYAPVAEAAAKP
jgi:hypothetical protein